jgi:hypothetical protein
LDKSNRQIELHARFPSFGVSHPAAIKHLKQSWFRMRGVHILYFSFPILTNNTVARGNISVGSWQESAFTFLFQNSATRDFRRNHVHKKVTIMHAPGASGLVHTPGQSGLVISVCSRVHWINLPWKLFSSMLNRDNAGCLTVRSTFADNFEAKISPRKANPGVENPPPEKAENEEHTSDSEANWWPQASKRAYKWKPMRDSQPTERRGDVLAPVVQRQTPWLFPSPQKIQKGANSDIARQKQATSRDREWAVRMSIEASRLASKAALRAASRRHRAGLKVASKAHGKAAAQVRSAVVDDPHTIEQKQREEMQRKWNEWRKRTDTPFYDYAHYLHAEKKVPQVSRT